VGAIRGGDTRWQKSTKEYTSRNASSEPNDVNKKNGTDTEPCDVARPTATSVRVHGATGSPTEFYERSSNVRKLFSYLSLVAVMAAVGLTTTGCFGPSDADVASENLSKAAEQFEIPRHIVGVNGITDKYLFEVIGYCSVETGDSGLSGALEVTCKVKDKNGRVGYKKTFLGLSDNVSYVVEQLEPARVSTTRYRVIFKPEALIPNFDRPGSGPRTDTPAP
jgi:hypothetical protein